MQTAKEIFLELLKHDGKPERELKQYEALHMCLYDPINTFLRGNRRRGSVSLDRWGTTISFPEDAPGAIPVHTPELTVCPDVTRWREVVHAPDLAASCTEGWEECRKKAREATGSDKLLAGFMGTGIFEQCHFLMDFENTLTAFYEHPDDSYLVPIVEDMAEIGIQVWQGTLPENDIPALQAQLKGKLVLMGGMGAAIDRADATPEEIFAFARKTLNICCPGGHFIPSITYGLPGAVYPQVDKYINEAIDEYNARLHFPKFPVAPVPRRRCTAPLSDAKKAQAETLTEQGDAFAAIASAIKRGQQKKLLSLVEKALADGESAQDILAKGLIVGMNELGEDFSASRAFVPEMLIAARCMTAATQLLKPHMVEEDGSSRSIGCACIGTVRGDMHDIGKNLVKIMFEGSGIEVYDLGADVPPEKFVETAAEHGCNIIACSSLLTTTMQEMRSVVELAEKAGIRDKVTIMIGGAPISQSFCDEIGADIYTADAASAARMAVKLLTKG